MCEPDPECVGTHTKQLLKWTFQEIERYFLVNILKFITNKVAERSLAGVIFSGNPHTRMNDQCAESTGKKVHGKGKNCVLLGAKSQS